MREFSFHDISHEKPSGKTETRWVVIEDLMTPDGEEVEDTELIATFRTFDQAHAACERLKACASLAPAELDSLIASYEKKEKR